MQDHFYNHQVSALISRNFLNAFLTVSDNISRHNVYFFLTTDLEKRKRPQLSAMGSADCDSLADSLIPCAGLAGGDNNGPQQWRTIVVSIVALPADGTNMYHDLLILWLFYIETKVISWVYIDSYSVHRDWT